MNLEEQVLFWKECGSCWEWKPWTLEYFSRNRGTLDGLQHWCKVCMNDYQTAYRRANPGAHRRRNQEYRQRRVAVRSAMLAAGIPFVPCHKEKRCPRCKETKPLTREYFHADLGRGSGFNSCCKACRSKKTVNS